MDSSLGLPGSEVTLVRSTMDEVGVAVSSGMAARVVPTDGAAADDDGGEIMLDAGSDKTILVAGSPDGASLIS
jgi:hypothetical protein